MSSLKKHTFTSNPPSIALHDFTPNVAFLHYDIDSAPRIETPEKKLEPSTASYAVNHEQKNFNLWLSNYVAAKKLYEANERVTRQLHVARKHSNITALNPDTPGLEVNHTAHPGNVGPEVLAQEFWLLTQQDRTLVKGGLRIALTAMESAIIKKMLHHEERVVSKDELIRDIGREPERYRGLEMCLSRLQDKFRRNNDGERLFRAVRNRGYCLTQKIKKPLEHSSTRR